MRRMAAKAISTMLALSLGLVACGGQAKTEETASPEEAVEEAGDEVVGGWAASDDGASFVSDEERALFEQATTGLVGVGYDPVAVVATQLVSGTNNLYLCRATPATADAETDWCFVTVYENLSGEAEVTNVADFDLVNLHTLDGEADPGMVGAWEVVDPDGLGGLPQDAATAFSGAIEGYEGVDLTPVTLLATQIVAGTNYRVLCVGTTVTAEPTRGLYVATVYEDLDGNAQMTSVEQLDITAYV